MSEMHHYQWNIKTALNAENKVGVKYANIIIIETSAHWDYKYFLHLQSFQMFLFFFNENVLLGWLIKLFTIFIDKKCVDVAIFVWFNLTNLMIRIFYLKTYIWALLSALMVVWGIQEEWVAEEAAHEKKSFQPQVTIIYSLWVPHGTWSVPCARDAQSPSHTDRALNKYL